MYSAPQFRVKRRRSRHWLPPTSNLPGESTIKTVDETAAENTADPQKRQRRSYTFTIGRTQTREEAKLKLKAMRGKRISNLSVAAEEEAWHEDGEYTAQATMPLSMAAIDDNPQLHWLHVFNTCCNNLEPRESIQPTGELQDYLATWLKQPPQKGQKWSFVSVKAGSNRGKQWTVSLGTTRRSLQSLSISGTPTCQASKTRHQSAKNIHPFGSVYLSRYHHLTKKEEQPTTFLLSSSRGWLHLN